MSYDDGRVACTDDALVIRLYHFPFGDKRIPHFVHWANFDPDRPKKSVALIIGISGRRMRPVITPDDPYAVAAEQPATALPSG